MRREVYTVGLDDGLRSHFCESFLFELGLSEFGPGSQIKKKKNQDTAHPHTRLSPSNLVSPQVRNSLPCHRILFAVRGSHAAEAGQAASGRQPRYPNPARLCSSKVLFLVPHPLASCSHLLRSMAST
jgi:hypothetical protein